MNTLGSQVRPAARRIAWTVFTLVALLGPAYASAPPDTPETPEAGPTNQTATPVRPSTKAAIDKDELLGHIQYLASEELRGREAGTPDQLKAAEYVANEFKRYGLEPFGDLKPETAEPLVTPASTEARPAGTRSWFQEFKLAECSGWAAGTHLKMKVGDKEKSFDAGKEFAPFSFSAPKGSAEAPVVFAGYGIEAPEYGYDDFKGIEVAGKWVLLLRYEPQNGDPASKFDGKQHTRHATFDVKLAACSKRKAAGVLMVTGPLGLEKPDPLTNGRGPANEEQTLPFFHLTREAADTLLKESGKDIAGLQAAIDKDLSNQSFDLKGVQVSGAVELRVDPKPTRNVIARVEGTDPKLKNEYLVIGAHCDHVGIGKFGSLLGKEGVGKIHPGADDNASGTAGLLEIAQSFGNLKPEDRPKRTILFMAFSGEEKGLLGSVYYIKHPELPMKDLAAMLNMDMIGRSEDGSIQVSGLGSSALLKEIVQDEARQTTLKFYFGSSGSGPSDHASFYDAGVPVLFFFTGLHPDYHRPSDTWDRIDARTAEKTALFARTVLKRLADCPERPKFVKAPQQGYLGVGPNHIAMRDAKGYPVGSVQPGSPAEAAGIRKDDLIIALNGRKIAQAMELSMSLLDFGPGDEMELELKRGAETIKVKAVLAVRGAAAAPRKGEAKTTTQQPENKKTAPEEAKTVPAPAAP